MLSAKLGATTLLLVSWIGLIFGHISVGATLLCTSVVMFTIADAAEYIVKNKS